MNFSIFKLFQIFGIVSSWAAKALSDGKITLEEAVQLAMQLADLLGVKIEFEVPEGMMTGNIDDKEKQIPKKETKQQFREIITKPLED